MPVLSRAEPMSTSEQVIISRSQGVLQIALNRPEKKNALNKAMYAAVTQEIEAADQDPEIKAILLQGTDDCFTSGNDLADFENRDPNKPSPGRLLLNAMHDCKKPVVAAVSGLAVGIGSTLLLHCDIVYATPDARFRMPFVNLGVCPEGGASLLLPELAGQRLAAELLLLGDFFNTQTAIEAGIVTRMVAGEELVDFAFERAVRLAQMPTEAMMQTKRLLKKSQHKAVIDRFDEEFPLFGQMLLTPESQAARQRALQRGKKPASMRA